MISHKGECFLIFSQTLASISPIVIYLYQGTKLIHLSFKNQSEIAVRDNMAVLKCLLGFSECQNFIMVFDYATLNLNADLLMNKI